ncbi:hypothetical protein B5C09_07785 [Staphylococcus delphini]|uniref:hypothetical protein n=1 Tax=Staphylococcus delphini TaxID=53344 RepID=UPI000BBCE269|nr:hypothetical protein B5C09_07785 [Staphylococcus delphini]PCF74953.1 hypothetical protein B4W71_04965 [Staphylococcus delphini]
MNKLLWNNDSGVVEIKKKQLIISVMRGVKKALRMSLEGIQALLNDDYVCIDKLRLYQSNKKWYALNIVS